MSSNKPSAGNMNDKRESSTPTTDDIARVLAYSLTLDGIECIKASKFKEAIEKFTQAILLFRDPVFFCHRSDVYFILRQYDAAIKDCHTAIELDPKCAEAYGNLGFTYMAVNRCNDAIEAYKKALELDPGNDDYKRDLASVEVKFKAETQQSSTPSTEVITKANALKEQGNEFMKASKFNEAIEKYTQALELNRDPVYYCNRSAAYCRLQKYSEAIKDCFDALLLDEKYVKALGRMAFIASCKGQYLFSVNYYKKALTMDPNNENYKENLALAQAKLREANQLP